MTTVGPTTTAARQNGSLGDFLQPQPRERTPWLLASLCLLIPILPSYLVPPGPLKSNGSPARLIAIVLLALAVLGFILIRRTAQHPHGTPRSRGYPDVPADGSPGLRGRSVTYR